MSEKEERRERPQRIRISSSDIRQDERDDFYIDDDIPDDGARNFKQNSIVDMLEQLSTDDETELRENWDDQLELEWDDSLIDTPLSNVSSSNDFSSQMQRIVINGKEYKINCALIAPYQEVLQHAGYTKEGLTAVMVFQARKLPNKNTDNYAKIMHHLFLHFLLELSNLVADSYILIVFTKDGSMPPLKWLVDNLDRTLHSAETYRQYSDYINRESNVAGHFDQKWAHARPPQKTLNVKAARFQQIKKAILSRRAQLAEKLRLEESEFAAELKTSRHNGRDNDLEALTRRVEEIKQERETARQEVAHRRKYQMWKRDNPRLRSAEVERRRQEMMEVWTDQTDEKAAERQATKDARHAETRQNQLELEQARIEAEMAQKRQQQKAQQLRDELKRQMDELTEREAKQNRLKNEERQLILEEQELNRKQLEQKRKEKRQKQQDYQNILYRQYRAQILRRAHEIERELEEDLDILERVALETRRHEHETEEKKRLAQQYAQDALTIMRQKLKEERDRQEEIDYLYREQASQWWEKREAEWAREGAIRAKLLKDVLAERQDQVRVKLERVKEKQADMLADRENVLRDIEQVKEQIKTERETQRQKQANLIEGLEEGVAERNQRIIAQIDLANKENELTEQTAREIEDLELEEERQIMANKPPVRQAWR